MGSPLTFKIENTALVYDLRVLYRFLELIPQNVIFILLPHPHIYLVLQPVLRYRILLYVYSIFKGWSNHFNPSPPHPQKSTFFFFYPNPQWAKSNINRIPK